MKIELQVERLYSSSRDQGAPLKALLKTLKPLQHHGIEGLKGSIQLVPMMLRGASFSDSSKSDRCCFYSLDGCPLSFQFVVVQLFFFSFNFCDVQSSQSKSCGKLFPFLQQNFVQNFFHPILELLSPTLPQENRGSFEGPLKPLSTILP